MNLFVEISLILALVCVVSLVAKLLRQPLIVGYILAGIIAGPYGLGLITAVESIELFSQIGIATLLFIVGLSLSPKVIKDLGRVSLITGIGQVIFTSLIGYGIARTLGLDQVASIYVSIALTFSSTIIILKLLTDRGDVNALYGKVAIGFLLVQDIIATIILMVVSTSALGSGSLWVNMGLLLVKGGLVFAALLLLGRYIFPPLLKYIANSTELLFVFALSYGLGMGSLFQAMGFSLEIGTLIAGVSLSTTSYAVEMSARMKPLRDFFIILFFVLLGSHMILGTIPTIIVPALILSLFVLIGNPIIVILLMNLLGFRRRTGFMAGLTVAQISEFSLILATLGFNLGHLSKDTLSLVTLVGLITISGSTYMIQYADQIYPKLEWLIKMLELKHKSKERAGEQETYEAIVFGFGRAGGDYVAALHTLDLSTLVVDHDPKAIEKLEADNVSYRFGDLSEPEFLEELPLMEARIVISTITESNLNRVLVRYLRKFNKKVLLIVSANIAREARELYRDGADYVIVPHYLGARYGASLLKKIVKDKSKLSEERNKHDRFLKTKLG